MIPTFPIPSAAVPTSGSIFAAARAYQAEAVTTLADGTQVKMTLVGAIRYIKAIRDGMPAFPVCVSEEILADGTVTRNYQGC